MSRSTESTCVDPPKCGLAASAGVDIISPDEIHNGPLLPTSSLPFLPTHIAVHDTLRNGEEDHREDRGSAAGRELLLAGVLPSKDSDGGVTPRKLPGALDHDVRKDANKMTTVGVCEFVCTSGAHGSSAPSAIRYGHLGCRRKHSGPFPRAGGGLPAPVAVDDSVAFDMHKHESCVGGHGPGGGQGSRNSQYPGVAW